jgi:hypothetical protein
MPTYNQLSPQRATFTFYAYVDGSAAAASYGTGGLLVGAGQLELKENSNGNYTVKLPRKFARILAVQLTPVTDVTTLRCITTDHTDQDEIQVEQVGADQTTPTADGSFFLTIVASDSSDEYPFSR